MARALSFVRFNSRQIERYTDEPKVSFGLHWNWVATQFRWKQNKFRWEFPRENSRLGYQWNFDWDIFNPHTLTCLTSWDKVTKNIFTWNVRFMLNRCFVLVFQSEWFDLFGLVCRRRFGFIWNSRPQRYHIATTTCDNPMRIRLWPREVEQFPMI